MGLISETSPTIPWMTGIPHGHLTVNGLPFTSSDFMDIDGEKRQTYLIDADGGNQRRLSNIELFELHPSWSPDGKRIAFTSRRDGDSEIYVIDTDGQNTRKSL